MTCPKYAASLLAQPLPDGTLLKDYPGPVGAHCIECASSACPHRTGPQAKGDFICAIVLLSQQEAPDA